MQEATAKKLSDLFTRQISDEMDVLRFAETSLPSDEYLFVRDIIGKVMGSIYLDALQPIYAEFPQFKPSHFP